MEKTAVLTAKLVSGTLTLWRSTSLKHSYLYDIQYPPSSLAVIISRYWRSIFDHFPRSGSTIINFRHFFLIGGASTFNYYAFKRILKVPAGVSLGTTSGLGLVALRRLFTNNNHHHHQGSTTTSCLAHTPPADLFRPFFRCTLLIGRYGAWVLSCFPLLSCYSPTTLRKCACRGCQTEALRSNTHPHSPLSPLPSRERRVFISSGPANGSRSVPEPKTRSSMSNRIHNGLGS